MQFYTKTFSDKSGTNIEIILEYSFLEFHKIILEMSPKVY